ncbi:integral membrane protein [Oryzomicrobium terrae]|uniref:Integral membrane protein n=1 Tax=Oryzomicrobium terrae TaxID=1735038 RepID=A0A5C1E3Z5_9RHOO|nr:DUF2189 domain-containing protein [Oryzomicrobium terrae]QEL63646.1 integral membrane protein [Oryzomicrobium terrae]
MPITDEKSLTFDLVAAIRPVAVGAPWQWLRAGWGDLRAHPLPSLAYGAVFALCGWLFAITLDHAAALLSALVTGMLLVGPFLALGLYDLSRRRERGEPVQLLASALAWRHNLSNIGLFAAVLAIVLMVWARASMVIFAVFYEGDMPSFAGFLRAFSALDNLEFVVFYLAVGGFFATLVFAVSVIAVPLMLDRRIDAINAAIASATALARNPAAMLLWAVLIVALTVLGFATGFLGLVVTMPLVGHATWHAYRALMPEPPAGA